jgi:alpha-L-fucosidase
VALSSRQLYEKPGEYGGYLPPRDVIRWLIDTVSKNGTFVLNVPGKPDGTIDSKEIAVLDGVTAWMEVNGEAIYETRPWKIYGEGPHNVKSGSVSGQQCQQPRAPGHPVHPQQGEQLWSTRWCWAGRRKRSSCRRWALRPRPNQGKWPGWNCSERVPGVNWKQNADGLRVELPKQYRPKVDYAAALKVSIA